MGYFIANTSLTLVDYQKLAGECEAVNLVRGSLNKTVADQGFFGRLISWLYGANLAAREDFAKKILERCGIEVGQNLLDGSGFDKSIDKPLSSREMKQVFSSINNRQFVKRLHYFTDIELAQKNKLQKLISLDNSRESDLMEEIGCRLGESKSFNYCEAMLAMSILDNTIFLGALGKFVDIRQNIVELRNNGDQSPGVILSSENSWISLLKEGVDCFGYASTAVINVVVPVINDFNDQLNKIFTNQKERLEVFTIVGNMNTIVSRMGLGDENVMRNQLDAHNKFQQLGSLNKEYFLLGGDVYINDENIDFFGGYYDDQQVANMKVQRSQIKLQPSQSKALQDKQEELISAVGELVEMLKFR